MKYALRKAISLIYPYKCILCGKTLPVSYDEPICPICKERIKFLEGEKLCKICGKPLSSDICEECERGKNKFDFHRAVAVYEGNWREIIHQYKYHEKFYLFKFLGKYLFQVYRANKIFQESDFIIPIPENYLDRIKRGYHQTYLLARYIGKKTGKKVINEILIKPKRIPSQTGLKAKERIKNVKGAYKVKSSKKIKDAKILLIDDVFTTGATINECSKKLKEKGAKEVYALTLARGE